MPILTISPVQSYTKADDTSTEGYKKDYKFSVNWFTHKIPLWTKILSEFKDKPGVNYLEIGTFEGRSALWVMENILTHPTAKATIIDAFRENTYKTFISNAELSGNAQKFNILTGYSTDKIREVPFGSIDFSYIDGSGKGIVMLSDLVNTWNVTKLNGIIICNRYPLDAGLRKALGLGPLDGGPHEAIDAFMKMYKPYVQVLAFEENQFIVRKIRE